MSKSEVAVDEVTLFTDAKEILELELLCAFACILDRPVLVIIDTINIRVIRRMVVLVSDLSLITVLLEN
jgi:hypothetical protein